MSSKTSTRLEPQILFESVKGTVYRIPAVLYDPDRKTLLAFAEKRQSKDDASSEALVMKQGAVKKEGNSVKIQWSEEDPDVMKKIDLKPSDTVEAHRPMNPCPVYDKTNKKVFLYFIGVEGTVSEWFQINSRINKVQLNYMTFNEKTQEKSTFIDLPNMLQKKWSTFAVGPGHGLQTEAGKVLIPAYAYPVCCCCCSRCSSFQCLDGCDGNSCFCKKKNSSPPRAFSICSDHEGCGFNAGNMLGETSLECQMAEVFVGENEGIVYCNARTQGGLRVEAYSKDEGKNFLKLTSELPETGSGCQGSVVSFPDQTDGADTKPRWLLYSHPTHLKARRDLGVYLNQSPNPDQWNPKAWSKPWIINPGFSGYSDLAYIGDGWFVCLMERGEKTDHDQIACVCFSYEDIKKGIGL